MYRPNDKCPRCNGSRQIKTRNAAGETIVEMCPVCLGRGSKLITKAIAFVLLTLLCGQLLAAEFRGKCLRVKDGDTIVVQKETKSKHKGKVVTVRLADIDAPELLQDFGHESHLALEHFCLNRDVVVRWDPKAKPDPLWPRRWPRVCAALYAE